MEDGGAYDDLPSRVLLDELSTAVREGSRNFHSLHRSTLQRILEDLLKEFRDDENAEE